MSQRLANKLLTWFDAEKRELPWRGTDDPYRIWVSEVMLQQTTVAAVRRRFEPFVDRFPDVASLARASEDEVLAAWSGLGYYARARNLRRAAIEMVARYGGSVPRDPAALDRLPGFGEYMSAAVASLAFGARLPAADANVERVISRVFAPPGEAGSSTLRSAVLERTAGLLPSDRPGDLTAALMDLGQTVCTPRAPECAACPIADGCRARAIGKVDAFPARRRRPRSVRLSLAAAVVRKRGRLFLVRRKATWLDGMWEFPSAVAATPEAARRSLAIRARRLGLSLEPGPPLARVRHAIVNRRLEIDVLRAVDARAPRAGDVARWFLPAELDSAAVPTLTRKIAAAVPPG